jgi:hypothetical protein
MRLDCRRFIDQTLCMRGHGAFCCCRQDGHARTCTCEQLSVALLNHIAIVPFICLQAFSAQLSQPPQ